LLFRTNPQEGFLIGSKLRAKKVLIIRQFGVRAKSCYSANRQISVTALVLDMSKKIRKALNLTKIGIFSHIFGSERPFGIIDSTFSDSHGIYMVIVVTGLISQAIWRLHKASGL
jgi:hypothetical protein